MQPSKRSTSCSRSLQLSRLRQHRLPRLHQQPFPLVRCTTLQLFNSSLTYSAISHSNGQQARSLQEAYQARRLDLLRSLSLQLFSSLSRRLPLSRLSLRLA